MRSAGRRRALAAACISVLAAGCGSTVAGQSGGASGTGPGAAPLDGAGGGGMGAAPPSLTRPANGSGDGVTGSGAAPAATRLSQDGSGSEVAPITPRGTTPRADGPGVTAKTLSLGVMYPTNGDAYQAALGNTTSTSGDVAHEVRYIVKDINDHGGIAGRRVVPVYYEVDATSGQSDEQAEQAACSKFTQDSRVFAAMLPGAKPASTLLACLKKAGVVVSRSGGLTGLTTPDYDRYPANFDATAISVDRLVANLVPVLQRAGYFSPWDTTAGRAGQAKAVVGVIVPDRPAYHHAVDVLVRALRDIGVAIAARDVVFYHAPDAPADDGQAVSEIQNAVLKFKADGVTHVIPPEVNGQAFFAAQADKQQYRPRYGVTSASSSQVYNGTLIPTSQLNGAVGLGFFPGLDLPPQMNPDNGPYSGPTRRYCLDVMTRNGVTFSDANAKAVALAICDGMYNLRAVLTAANGTGSLNQGTVAAALDHIGTVPSATYREVSYGPHRRDAVSSGFQWQYFSDCQCMHYTGKRFDLT
jgi:hypothetical protein